ncbi:MAG: arsenite methyltransferase [Patescibacteria group bacterium]
MEKHNVKAIVKNRYASIARTSGSGCGCSRTGSTSRKLGYTEDQLAQVGDADLGLGCGNPVAFSSIEEGDTVLDLGSGAGIDCFLASKKAGLSGKVIGIDFTEEMVVKAKTNALKGGFDNVEFRLGDIEKLPIDSGTVDIIISNCVINLAPDKDAVFAEAFRVLKPGGRLFVSDIVLLAELTEKQRNDENLLSGCVAGALRRDKYIARLERAGFDVEILSENKHISKEQYEGIPLESLLVEARKP